MRRVAYVCADPGVPVFGQKGCSIHVQEVVRAFRHLQLEVVVFVSRKGGEPAADLRDLEVHEIPVETASRPAADPAAREIGAVRNNRRIRNALLRCGRVDFVYERYSLWSYAGMEHAREQEVPGILEVNAPLIEEQSKHRTLVNLRLARSSSARVFDAASALVAVSEEVKDYVEHFQRARGKVVVIPNGVDIGRFGKRETRRTDHPFTVGFVGTLKRWHGTDLLLKSFPRVLARAEARLFIVGDGPQREALQRLAEELGISSQVTFTGMVSPTRVAKLLAEMDVAVAPYPKLQEFYFSPLKVYEYMAAGLPVIASEIGQLKALIEHERNGLLVPPGDVVELSKAIVRLSQDEELRDRLGAAGYARVAQHHSWESVANQILKIASIEVRKFETQAVCV